MNGILRLLLATPLALLVTAGLLLFMISLVQLSEQKYQPGKSIKLPDIYMPDEASIQQRSVVKPRKPKLEETPPPEIPQQAFKKIDGNTAITAITAPTRVSAELDLAVGSRLNASDGEYLPIVKVAPQYPRRALSRGIEGYVVLEYTVTTTGTVRDVTVVDAKPSGIFDRAAIKSASRYKYKPRVENGQAIEVPGVRTKINFVLKR